VHQPKGGDLSRYLIPGKRSIVAWKSEAGGRLYWGGGQGSKREIKKNRDEPMPQTATP